MSRFVCCGLAIVAGAGLMLAAAGVKGRLADRGDRQVVPELGEPVATYSILGYDPETGEIGGAVQSRVFSVGNGVLWGEADVGVVATQAVVDVSYGPKALELLRQGIPPEEVVRRIWESDPDPHPDTWSKYGRQFAVMNARGEVAVYTGPRATEWAGHRIGKYASAQGNILASEEVVEAMIRAFETTEGHLSFRLLAALEAGQAAGGDRRGDAVGRHADRQEGRRRLVEQRRGPAAPGGRQPRAAPRVAPVGGEGGGAAGPPAALSGGGRGVAHRGGFDPRGTRAGARAPVHCGPYPGAGVPF